MSYADKINLAIAVISGLSVLVSAAVCVATFRILKATQDTLKATRAQMLAARRPYLDVGAVVDEGHPVLSLVIRNTGASSAERVRLTMDQDFLFNGKENGKNIRGLPIFNGPVDSIPPRAEIKLMLGVGRDVYAQPERCPPRFTVRAQYAFEGMEFDESSSIDLNAFKGHSIGKGPQAQALEKIASATEVIAKHLKATAS